MTRLVFICHFWQNPSSFFSSGGAHVPKIATFW